jgi:DNA-binding NarL/FixJ family response regulator
VREARIHLARMSPLLRRMITDLLAPEEDIEIVGVAEGAEESLVVARTEGANMIITQDQREGGDACLSAILSAQPLTILAIEPGGSIGTSVNLERQQLSLEGGDGKSLAQAIRKALELI